MRRLITALAIDADFFVHVDAKVPIEMFEPAEWAHNVTFITERVKVYWAGFSVVQATLNLMAAAHALGHYERYVLLNGLDYPIKPTSLIIEHLLENPEKEFIRFFDIEEADPLYVELATRYHFFDAPRVLVNRYYDLRKAAQTLARPFRKRLPRPYRHCFGHMQWALTSNCVEYILDFDSRNSSLRAFYRTAFAPDERYLHTIVANSPFCDRAGGIEPYTGFGTYRMANLHHIDPSLNKTFTEADYAELAASDKVFVKKITSEQSLELIRLIDEKLRIVPFE